MPTDSESETRQKNKNEKDGTQNCRDPKKQQRRRDLKNAKYNADAVRRKQATAAWENPLQRP